MEESIQTPVQTSPVTPKKNPGIMISLFLLIFGIVLGVVLSKTTILTNVRIPFLTPTPTPMLPTPTPDPTVGWKIFTDPKNIFSFQYPPELVGDNCGISGPAKDGATHVICLGDPKTMREGTDKPFDGLSVYTQNFGQNFQTYIENEKTIQRGWGNSMGNSQTTNGTESTLLVSDRKAIVLNNYSWDSIERLYIQLPANIVLIIAKGEESKGSFITFNNILSTFRFMNEDESISEKKFGFIKAITQNNDAYYLSIDEAQLISDSNQPNGYRINNPSHDVTRILLGGNPSIIMNTFSHASDGNVNFNQIVSFNDFLSKFQSDPTLQALPYWFTVTSGRVTKITEQFLP